MRATMSILLTVVAVLVAQITITKARSIEIDPHEIEERSFLDFEEFLTPVLRDASIIKGKHGRKKPVVKIVSLDDLEKIAKNKAHTSSTIGTANDETPFAIIISSNPDPADEIENDVEDLTHFSFPDEADLKTQPKHEQSDEVKLETETSKEGDGKKFSDSKDESQFRILDKTEDENENSEDSHDISDSEETITGRIVPGKLQEEQQIIQPKNADDSNLERYNNNNNFNESPEDIQNEYTTQRIDVEIDTPHLLDDDERFDAILEPYDESIQYKGVLFEDSENLKESSHINEIRGRDALNIDRKEVDEDFTREGSADESENGKMFVYETVDENGEDFAVEKVKYLSKDFDLNANQKNLRKCERHNEHDVTNKSYHLLITFN